MNENRPAPPPGGSPLSSAEAEGVRRLLLEKRDSLTRSQQSRLEELSDPSEKHHIADLEEMDGASVDMDSLCQIMDMSGSTVTRIDAALQRLEAGTYGLCDACEEPIPRARLEALPFADLCVGCQREKELEAESSPS